MRSALSCATRQLSEIGEPAVITGITAPKLAAAHANTRVKDNVEKLLRVIAARSMRPGDVVKLQLATDFTLIDCFKFSELRQYIHWIHEDGLVTRLNSANLPVADLILNMQGWNQIQPLPRQGGIPGRCFVAMWFSNETRLAYEGGIVPAVRKAGCTPIRIDQKEHNNEIPDEIWAEIRNCQFMVADFTGQRQGVYFEAGFAMGLGSPVIWCCQKDEIEKLHFDTNHRNHIAWSDPNDLAERLYKRIRMTILEKA